MLSLSRKVALVVLASVAIAATGCGGNAKKIVGKWNVVSAGGKELKGDDKATPYMEFKNDGTATFGVAITDPKVKELLGDGFSVSFKYSVSGDTLELSDLPKDGKGAKGEGPFGKTGSGKAKIKFEGDDTLVITPDDEKDKPMKLTRSK
jgi:hypothetical protein